MINGALTVDQYNPRGSSIVEPSRSAEGPFGEFAFTLPDSELFTHNGLHYSIPMLHLILGQQPFIEKAFHCLNLPTGDLYLFMNKPRTNTTEETAWSPAYREATHTKLPQPQDPGPSAPPRKTVSDTKASSHTSSSPSSRSTILEKIQKSQKRDGRKNGHNA